MGRPPIGKTAMTDAERMRRYRLKRGPAKPVTKPVTKPASADADNALKAKCTALEQELAAAKARIAELTDEMHGMLAQRFSGKSQRPAKPKAEKPPLPPDEARERIIKGLRTRVHNVTQEFRYFRQLHEEEMTKQGLMSRETRTAIDKALHPDTRGNATVADKDRACQGWNVWKNDHDKARRQAR